ncbi:MAG: hypothetical protein JWM76_2291 [Pseudonocardiales bacterium]|nr:hypothetical protein [Pseudonocardiales bacterium]
MLVSVRGPTRKDWSLGRLRLEVLLHRSQLHTGRTRAISQSLIPDRKQRVGDADGKQTSQVHRVCPPERVLAGKLAGVSSDLFSQLDRPGRRPIGLPRR